MRPATRSLCAGPPGRRPGPPRASRPCAGRLHQNLLLPEIADPVADRGRLLEVQLLGGAAHLLLEPLELLLHLLGGPVERLRLRGGRLGDAHVVALPYRSEDLVDGLDDRLRSDAVLLVVRLLA